jgi:hypothetical protein
MLIIKRSTLIFLFVLWPLISWGQNWMIAQKYLVSAIDSLICINWPNTGKLISYQIKHIEYDDILEDFIISFTDTISYCQLDIQIKKGEKSDIIAESGELRVSLVGGVATFTNENGEETDLELSDLSEDIYLYNATGKEISFLLSPDNKSFTRHSIKHQQIYAYKSFTKEYVYISMIKSVKGNETSNLPFKLEKAKGYKISYDRPNSKFEVQKDMSMDIEDFRK